jgi:GT2 family glycosyltransferase
MHRIVVVVPNWNGEDSLKACLDSLLLQVPMPHIIVVDNGSVDGSLTILQQYPDIEVIKHSSNKGYSGGVNPGFQRAIEYQASYVAAFNNDAIAQKNWLSLLVSQLDNDKRIGIATSKILSADGTYLDSTGECYSVWGLAYPRGRGETKLDTYDSITSVFGASGGASLYRVGMLEHVGLLDENFFAYYEDVDLSFRAQLAGWKVAYVPEARAYHAIGATSGKMPGFTTYQTLKNLPMLLIKNVPRRYFLRVALRYELVQALFIGRAIISGRGWPAIKGKFMSTWLLPSSLRKRRQIQKTRQVSDEYIWSMLIHDLPPNALALRRLRAKWRKLLGKRG